jgi:hypothetical protein
MSNRNNLKTRRLAVVFLLAFLILDSAGSRALAQREGGAFWGPFAHGGSHGAATGAPGCAPGYITRNPRCDQMIRPGVSRPRAKSSTGEVKGAEGELGPPD